MKWRNILIVFLFFLAGFLAYNYFEQPFLKYFPEPVIDQPTEGVEETEQNLDLPELSTREKLTQMLMLPLVLDNEQDPADNDNLALIQEYQPGFVVYFGEEIDFATAKKYQESLLDGNNKKVVLPLLAVDHEGGRVQRLSGEGFTPLPSMRQLTNAVSSIDEEQDTNPLNARERRKLFNQ